MQCRCLLDVSFCWCLSKQIWSLKYKDVLITVLLCHFLCFLLWDSVTYILSFACPYCAVVNCTCKLNHSSVYYSCRIFLCLFISRARLGNAKNWTNGRNIVCQVSGCTSRDLSGIYESAGILPPGPASVQTLQAIGGLPQFQQIATVLPTNFFPVIPAGHLFSSQGPTIQQQAALAHQHQQLHHATLQGNNPTGLVHQQIAIPTIITTAHVDNKTGKTSPHLIYRFHKYPPLSSDPTPFHVDVLVFARGKIYIFIYIILCTLRTQLLVN